MTAAAVLAQRGLPPVLGQLAFLLSELSFRFAAAVGNIFWCLSCWCLGGLSIVFRWSLAFWPFGGVSVVSYPSYLVFWVFCLCLGGVSVVSWRCSRVGGMQGPIFF